MHEKKTTPPIIHPPLTPTSASVPSFPYLTVHVYMFITVQAGNHFRLTYRGSLTVKIVYIYNNMYEYIYCPVALSFSLQKPSLSICQWSGYGFSDNVPCRCITFTRSIPSSSVCVEIAYDFKIASFITFAKAI